MPERFRQHPVPPSNARGRPRVDVPGQSHFLLDQKQNLFPAHRVGRAFGTQRALHGLEHLEQVEVAIFVGSDSKSDRFCITALRTFWRRNQSIVALDRMRWKDQRQFGCGAVGVFLGQPDHRVLHDVQRRVVVTHGIDRALEGALLDALEEIGEFFVGGQGGLGALMAPGDRRRLCHPAWGQAAAASQRCIMLLRTICELVSIEAAPTRVAAI
jgi:hypothetical protein